MSHNHRVIVHRFTATDADPIVAIDAAGAQLEAWYATQETLFSHDGTSLFQFGAWLLTLPNGQYQYIITAIDARRAPYQG